VGVGNGGRRNRPRQAGSAGGGNGRGRQAAATAAGGRRHRRAAPLATSLPHQGHLRQRLPSADET